MSLAKVQIYSKINDAQLERVKQIANESYIKSVTVGFNSYQNCVCGIVDDKDRISSVSIDKQGNYINYL